MKTQNLTLKDRSFLIGIILIVISFLFHLFLSYKRDNTFTSFMEDDAIYYVNYVIALAYFLGVFFMGIIKVWFKFSQYNYKRFICAITLFSISCYTINYPVPIFAKFDTWVNIYIILMHVSLLALCFHEYFSKALKIANYFLLGLGAMLSLYFTIYLLPYAPLGVIAAIFFGLSLHLLVPAIMLTTMIVQFIKRAKTFAERAAFYSGVLIPLLVITTYCIKWNSTKKLIHKTHASIVTRPDNNLPNWVLLSQELDNDLFTEQILKGDLVYQNRMFSDFGMGFGISNSLAETKMHNPLVSIGSELMGDINLGSEDRIKILESKYDLRHQTKRKLWSGKHLSTTSVISNIQVFPEYRLAYAEKILRIKNNIDPNTWERQEEALYTFHLPEGSVATSLSLWIDGKEEKSRLTTKSKADSAYTTIVGVERRDPSIMHWQEGNTITVYVFPCTQKEERMFKIGITSPLKKVNNKLVLENIYFEGPDANSALETTVVEFKTDANINADLPLGFEEILPNKFQYDGNYKSYWEINCDATKLSTLPFSFNGKNYRLAEAKPQLTKTDLSTFYLDINKTWSDDEFEQVWSLVKNKKAYVFYDRLYELNEGNKDQLFETLNSLNFSLFPIDKIKNEKHAMLISKSNTVAPMLKDLKGAGFVDDLKDYLVERKNRINLYNLSNEISPYLKTLKEFQVFNYAAGNTVQLKNYIKNNAFISDNQNKNTVKLGIANTLIQRDTNTSQSQAPDHLLRLFAYNKIMQECGRNYFTSGNFIEESLIDIANEAYIVSPVSSLIVLETLKDYDRFDIKKNKNSLNNASTQSAGAVPEPHEWALIILLTLTLGYLYYKKKFALKN